MGRRDVVCPSVVLPLCAPTARLARLLRSGGEDPAALKQPLRPKGVNYVLGTFCIGSLRTEHLESGAGDGNRNYPRSVFQGLTQWVSD